MKKIVLLSAVGLTMLLASCEHKDLCYNHEDHALYHRAMINATYEQEWEYYLDENSTDWETNWLPEYYGFGYDYLCPALPGGLRALVYNQDGSYDTHNLSVSGGEIYTSEGKHSMVFYNNDTEYIMFNNLGTYAEATATTRARSRVTYLGNTYMESSKAEYTVNPPDMLYGSYIDTISLPKQHEHTQINVTMKPLVFTYLVRYEFEYGLKFVALSRGALAGMAGSVYLKNGHTSDEPVTVLYDCYTTDYGVEAKVQSFGIPGYPTPNYSRGDNTYALNLEVRMGNGKIKVFEFDVTDQVKYQPLGGVIVVKGLRIEEDEGMEGGSGFDVDVEGWGDYEDVPIIF